MSRGYLPEFLQPFYGFAEALFPWAFGEGGIELGPIPAGTPVGLISNLNPLVESSDPVKRLEHDKQLPKLVLDLNNDLKNLGKYASDEQAAQVLGNRVDEMLNLSKCPDLVVNRGHYFGTGYLEPAEKADPQLAAQALNDRGPGLSDEDKLALIEFLKTF